MHVTRRKDKHPRRPFREYSRLIPFLSILGPLGSQDHRSLFHPKLPKKDAKRNISANSTKNRSIPDISSVKNG